MHFFSLISESVAYHWGPKTGLILYHFYEISQPNTKFDILSMGFITPLDDAVLIRIDSQSTNDYFELEIVNISFIYCVPIKKKKFYYIAGLNF